MNTLNSERRNVIKTGLALIGASILPGQAAAASEKEPAQKRRRLPIRKISRLAGVITRRMVLCLILRSANCGR